DEEVVVVDVDLRPLVAREHVLEIEGVEVEVLLQPGALEGAGALDVDPAQAAGVDLLDPGGFRLRLGRRNDEIAASTRPPQPGLRKVRHLARSSSRRALPHKVSRRSPIAMNEISPGKVLRYISATSRGVEGLAH